MFPLINHCTNMFIDINDKFYCSLGDKHQVVKINIRDSKEKMEIGNGTRGSTSNLLNRPTGIFACQKLNLYVADSRNKGIQWSLPQRKSGTTILSNGLNFPTGIVVDKNGNLLIADHANHRIVMSTINGIRCVAGCSRVNQLKNPKIFWFDDVGNMFVFDTINKEIQKFPQMTNLYGIL